MKFKLLTSLFVLLIPFTSYSADMADYVTPDSWSKNITANGVKASANGISLGEKGGNLTLGLTTRYQLKISDGTNSKGFQYFRARLSDTEVGNGTLAINLNMRVGADFNMDSNNPREYFVFYDGFNVEAGSRNWDFRLYQANIVLDDVVKGFTLALGRTYLDNIGQYKIDGIDIAFSSFEDAVRVKFFYGLPVSYYSNLKTQVVGVGVDISLFNNATRIQAEYNYFASDLNNSNSSDNVLRVRLNQQIFFANLYGELDQIREATIFKVGADGLIDATGTGFSIYMGGQYNNNNDGINPYISLFEDVVGEASENFNWGFEIYQGITQYLMVALGYEQRYNYDESYADRDYYRIYGNLDFIGVFHPQNFLSVIADYYIVPSYGNNGKNSKFLIGGRMSQAISQGIDMWAGVNVASYKYKANPIDLNPVFNPNLTDFDFSNKTESTNDFYIGGQWSPLPWLTAQADYTYSITNIFNTYDSGYDDCHTVALWLNLGW